MLGGGGRVLPPASDPDRGWDDLETEDKGLQTKTSIATLLQPEQKQEATPPSSPSTSFRKRQRQLTECSSSILVTRIIIQSRKMMHIVRLHVVVTDA